MIFPNRVFHQYLACAVLFVVCLAVIALPGWSAAQVSPVDESNQESQLGGAGSAARVSPVDEPKQESQLGGARQQRIDAEPPAVRLAGFWSTKSVSRDVGKRYVHKGYMVLVPSTSGRHSGYSLSTNSGPNPVPRPITFWITATPHKNRLWIDIVDEHGTKQLGICELSDDSSRGRMCFHLPADGSRTDARPGTIADADGFVTIELKRLELRQSEVIPEETAVLPSSAETPAAAISPLLTSPKVLQQPLLGPMR